MQANRGRTLPRVDEHGSANWIVVIFCGVYIILSSWLILQVSANTRSMGAFSTLSWTG